MLLKRCCPPTALHLSHLSNIVAFLGEGVDHRLCTLEVARFGLGHHDMLCLGRAGHRAIDNLLHCPGDGVAQLTSERRKPTKFSIHTTMPDNDVIISDNNAIITDNDVIISDNHAIITDNDVIISDNHAIVTDNDIRNSQNSVKRMCIKLSSCIVLVIVLAALNACTLP